MSNYSPTNNNNLFAHSNLLRFPSPDNFSVKCSEGEALVPGSLKLDRTHCELFSSLFEMSMQTRLVESFSVRC
eukprot:3717588-Amphidinium_carterae.2